MEGVGIETGETQQPTLDDELFAAIPRREIPTIKLSFSGSIELTLEEYEALTDKQLAPGRIVYVRAAGYVPMPAVAWIKKSEKDEFTGEREVSWENQGRIPIKLTEIAGLEVTTREWSTE